MERCGSLLTDCGALGQTLNFLCLIFLLHNTGTTVPTSQICWEVKLDCVLESTLQSAAEVMFQQHYHSLTSRSAAQGSHCAKCSSPHVAAELSSRQAVGTPGSALTGTSSGRATLLCAELCHLQNSYVKALVPSVVAFGDRLSWR